jgi:hypothetical protein
MGSITLKPSPTQMAFFLILAQELPDSSGARPSISIFVGLTRKRAHPGEVFKSTDYTDVSFSPTITVAQPPVWTGGVPPAALFVEGVQLIRGGWQGESFHSHHHDWDKLFDAANRGTSGCSGRK